MKNLLLILLVLFMTISCDKNEEMPAGFEDGAYVGYFSRSSPNTKYQSANVTLTLDKGQFIGTSDIAYYPAICKGTYNIIGQEIEFTNECVWTAQFDWTYILSGKYKIKVEGEKLMMSRGYEGAVFDSYVLIKQQEPK